MDEKKDIEVQNQFEFMGATCLLDANNVVYMDKMHYNQTVKKVMVMQA